MYKGSKVLRGVSKGGQMRFYAGWVELLTGLDNPSRDYPTRLELHHKLHHAVHAIQIVHQNEWLWAVCIPRHSAWWHTVRRD